MPIQITARINTLNEEDNIGPALASLSWADELLVVDTFSRDRTVEIARRMGARVVQRDFKSHGDQHNHADSIASHDWVFVLDADERVTPPLRASIEAVKRSTPAADGYRMPRLAWYLGRWIHHSGWYPNYQTRLYRRAVSRWDGEPPHEAPKVNGRVDTLEGDLLHFTRRSLHEHIAIMNFYTDLASAARHRNGQRGSVARMALDPLAAWMRAYVTGQGFRDGWQGLVIACGAAYYVHAREAKLIEKTRVGAWPPEFYAGLEPLSPREAAGERVP